MFDEVEDNGQETVGSRWVITRKEKADGQKQEVKGRLVAKGFQGVRIASIRFTYNVKRVNEDVFLGSSK